MIMYAPIEIAQGPNEEERGVVDDAQGTHPENTFKYDCGHLSRLSITAIHVGLMSRQARIIYSNNLDLADQG